MNGLAILDFVGSDLRRVEAKMQEMCSDAFGPLGEAFLQLLGSGGKRLRPAVALMAHRIFTGQASERSIALAAAVETLHNATLVHDDLIDGAILRRGRSTLNATWTRGATVLAGDYLFARSAAFAADTENLRVIQLFAATLSTICDGELRQLFSSRQWRQTKEAYYPRIFAKTASLFAAATRSGAILGGADAGMEQALHDYGYHLGMAFQIVDDILDFVGDPSTVGKPTGSDLRQGTVTLPFFYYVQRSGDEAGIMERLEASQKGNESDAIMELVAEIRQSPAIEDARKEACGFADRAKVALEPLPASAYTQSLADLADFVVQRDL